ncbi:thiamine monophosphate kinase [Microbacterium sp. W4I4]|uniref:hypothetical protein n=1 Tax=Microbacterium sp. W4I4 TaxID=3042295 RepID=UPI00278A9CFC|nr:hypothetical protein [Microbacterium sp. W4I4]MDQ0614473.1 thiamine monophosphate kinase [Microbacterium sp. W4I4]
MIPRSRMLVGAAAAALITAVGDASDGLIVGDGEVACGTGLDIRVATTGCLVG